MIVMLPFPPSVRILVFPTTGFPENAEVGYKIGSTSSIGFDGGGVRIRWLMSFKVTSPRAPHGLMKENGWTMDETGFVGVFTYDFLPECEKIKKGRLVEPRDYNISKSTSVNFIFLGKHKHGKI